MLVNLVEMGDSLALRIPEALLQQIGAGKSVELCVEDGRLVIQAVNTSRRQWEDALASLMDWVDGSGSLGEVPDLPRHCGSSGRRP